MSAATTTISLAPHHQTKVGFRVRELSDYGIGKSKAHQLIRQGRLAAVHLDGCVIVPREALIDFLATAKVIAPKREAVRR
jgi:hypothetical protein